MRKIKERLISLIFAFPFLLHTTIFVLYPTWNTIVLSFKENYSLLSDSFSGYGIGNYIQIFDDKYFAQSIRNTVIYTIITVPVVLFLALVMACMLNNNIRCIKLFQTSFFMPLVTATTAISYSWRLIFNSQYGVLNSMYSFLGIETVQWLFNPKYSMCVLIICGIWNMLPFSVLILLSALQGINKDYYVAASLDGANSFKVFFKITLPAIYQSVVLLGILNIISAFKVFDELFTLFSGKPGPSYNMYTLVYYMYEQMQTQSRGAYGRAAAAAIVLFLILLCISVGSILLKNSIKQRKKRKK